MNQAIKSKYIYTVFVLKSKEIPLFISSVFISVLNFVYFSNTDLNSVQALPG